MRKNVFGVLSGVLIIVCTFSFFNIRNKQDGKKELLNSLFLANVEALAGNESGAVTGEVKCYDTYNSCWFWNCEHIWRCDANDCYDVKCDAKSDEGKCYKY